MAAVKLTLENSCQHEYFKTYVPLETSPPTSEAFQSTVEQKELAIHPREIHRRKNSQRNLQLPERKPATYMGTGAPKQKTKSHQTLRAKYYNCIKEPCNSKDL